RWRNRRAPDSAAPGPRDGPAGGRRTKTPSLTHHTKPVAIAATAAHVVFTDGLGGNELAGPPTSRPQGLPRSLGRRRVKKVAPQRPQDAIGQPRTIAPGQSAFRCSPERGTIRRREWTAKVAD